MLSTDPGQSLNKEMLTLPACAPVLHVRCEVPTQRKKLFLFLGPFPKPGAVLEVQTRTILLTDSWRVEPKLGADSKPENWPRSCSQTGWQLTGHLGLASEAGSPAEITHLPNADSWAMEEPEPGVQTWDRPQGSSSCRDMVIASWLESILCFQTYISSWLKFQVVMKILPLFQIADLSLNNFLKIWAPLLSAYYQEFTCFLQP